jgi:hypothetical protein
MQLTGRQRYRCNLKRLEKLFVVVNTMGKALQKDERGRRQEEALQTQEQAHKNDAL